MHRVAGSCQLVALRREAHHLDVSLQEPERREELLTLLDRATEVVLRVQDEERRGDRLRVRRWRHRDVGVQVLVQEAPDVALEVPAEVARSPHRHPLVDGALGDGRLEPVGVPDDPRREVPAVGAAHHAQPLRVAEFEPAKRLVEHGHDVLVVDAPPAGAFGHRAADRAPPLLAVARGPARVRVQHDVAGARIHLELVEEPVPVLRERAAVDVQEHGIRRAGLEPCRTDDPRFHVGAVPGGGGEAFGLDQLTTGDEPPADVTHLAVTDEQLRRRSRRGQRVRDGPSRRVVARDACLAPDRQLGLPVPVGRDAIDVHVAAVLDREHQVGAVPDRLADDRVRSALAIERRREHLAIAAVRGAHRHLAVPRVVEDTRREQVRDARPVGRPRGRVARAVPERHLARLPPAAHIDDMDVGDVVDVPVLVARGRKGNPLAVGRPRRARLLVFPGGELDGRRRSVDRDEEQVLGPVAGPADRVELEVQPREPARRTPLVVLHAVGGVGHPGRERDPRAVRCPDDVRDVLLHVRELARLTPADRHDEELHVIASTLRRERQALPVGRPSRGGVPGRAGGELARQRRSIDRC